MVAFDAFDFDVAWRFEGDVLRRADCRTNGFGDENLASASLACNPRSHGYVESEEIVASPYRLARVYAHAYPNVIPAVRVFAQSLLNDKAASQGLGWVRERDHEAVALVLHNVPP